MNVLLIIFDDLVPRIGAVTQEQLYDLRADPGEDVVLLHGGRSHGALAGLRRKMDDSLVTLNVGVERHGVSLSCT